MQINRHQLRAAIDAAIEDHRMQYEHLDSLYRKTAQCIVQSTVHRRRLGWWNFRAIGKEDIKLESLKALEKSSGTLFYAEERVVQELEDFQKIVARLSSSEVVIDARLLELVSDYVQ